MKGSGAGKVPKSGKRRRIARRVFPIVGHAIGASGDNWTKHWLDARKSEGLNATTDGMLMPAPRPGGGWSVRALGSDEGSTWLRELLVQVLSGASLAQAGLLADAMTQGQKHRTY